jgi:hypothetical protein
MAAQIPKQLVNNTTENSTLHVNICNKSDSYQTAITNTQTPWPLVRERTIPTDRPPLVDEDCHYSQLKKLPEHVIILTDITNILSKRHLYKIELKCPKSKTITPLSQTEIRTMIRIPERTGIPQRRSDKLEKRNKIPTVR